MPHLIRGVVRDPAGRPVASARAFFAGGPAAVPDVAALTDDRGAFVLSVPTTGTWELRCDADGFAPAVERVEVSGDESTVEMRLRPA
jgi:Carboxypeptidase regulatory-like domain